MSMMPGMGQMKGGMPEVDESAMGRVEAIILSMTREERANPSLMNPSRKQRIARGAGVDISEVNRIVKQFDQMKKMMKHRFLYLLIDSRDELWQDFCRLLYTAAGKGITPWET